MKKAILIMLVLLVGSVAAITSNVQWHTLQQIQRSASDSISIDQDNDGKIDIEALPASVGGAWQSSGDNIYYNGGMVGIGTDTPGHVLDLGPHEAIVITDECTLAAGANYIQCTDTAFGQLLDSGHLVTGARMYMSTEDETDEVGGYAGIVTGYSDSDNRINLKHANQVMAGFSSPTPYSFDHDTSLTVSNHGMMIGDISDEVYSYETANGMQIYYEGPLNKVRTSYHAGNFYSRISSSGGVVLFLDDQNKHLDSLREVDFKIIANGNFFGGAAKELFHVYETGEVTTYNTIFSQKTLSPSTGGGTPSPSDSVIKFYDWPSSGDWAGMGMDAGGYFWVKTDSVATPPKVMRFTPAGSLTIDGSVIGSSDVRLKKNIEPIDNALDKVEQLNGVYYELKDGMPGRQIGLIAQDVEKVLPELVQDVGDYKGVDYPKTVAVLVEAVKEQQKIIEDQQRQIDELKEKLD